MVIRLAGGNKYTEGAESKLRRHHFGEVVATGELAVLSSSSDEGFAAFVQGTSDLDDTEGDSVGSEDSLDNEGV